ncbi:MAG TPA: hypothetical protein VK966_10860 [Longimicrobiales bacterium]|nr:hypothetical protein [Longimicrobiales bacterium]
MGPNRSGRSPGISALAVALVVAGCASTGANPASAGEETVSITSVDGSINADLRLTRDDQASGGDVTAPLETVWASIPAAFERVGLPAPQLDRSRRTAVVSNHVVRRRLGEHRLSRLLRCGRGITQPHADTHRVHLAVANISSSSA